mgnify:CR=1 FL=1
MIQQAIMPCNECNGCGESISHNNLCTNCDGQKFTIKNKVQEFPLKNGLETGNKIQLSKKGHHLKDRDHGKKYHADSDWIQKCQNEGRGVYIVINDGGDTDKEITNCRALFVEWDDRDKFEQINAWKDLGLVEPSLQIDTGGKSIHNYWILKKGIDAKTWRVWTDSAVSKTWKLLK